MTSAILEYVDPSDLAALHSVYVAVYRAHKLRPELFTVGNCTTAITALMSFNPFAWRVVGITPAALQKYSELNFRHQSNQGLTRAHLRPRLATVRDLVAPAKPLDPKSFITTLLRYDATVLCARGENKDEVPPFIAFDNDDARLFTSQKVGWKHTNKERDFLRTLFSSSSSQTLTDVRGKSAVVPAPSDRCRDRGYFDRSLLATDWDDAEVAKRRKIRDPVTVDGELFSSTYRAFQALVLPIEDCQAFRKCLKLAGRLIYVFRGRSYDFEVLRVPDPPTAPDHFPSE